MGLAVWACSDVACTAFEPGADTLPDTEAAALDPVFIGAASAGAEPAGATGDWACLAEATSNEPSFTDLSRRFVYTARIETLFGDVPANAVIRACSTADLDCVRPVATDIAIDAQGLVRVPLFWGFDGYLEIRADGVLPSAFYLRAPVYADSTQTVPLQVAPLDAISGFVAANGVTLREDRALLAIEVFDCGWALASGVQVASDGGGVPFSFTNGLPTIGESVTDGRGLAGALNVPPGVVRGWADVAATGQRIGARTISARAGWLSGFAIVPPILLRAPE